MSSTGELASAVELLTAGKNLDVHDVLSTTVRSLGSAVHFLAGCRFRKSAVSSGLDNRKTTAFLRGMATPWQRDRADCFFQNRISCWWLLRIQAATRLPGEIVIDIMKAYNSTVLRNCVADRIECEFMSSASMLPNKDTSLLMHITSGRLAGCLPSCSDSV